MLFAFDPKLQICQFFSTQSVSLSFYFSVPMILSDQFGNLLPYLLTLWYISIVAATSSLAKTGSFSLRRSNWTPRHKRIIHLNAFLPPRTQTTIRNFWVQFPFLQLFFSHLQNYRPTISLDPPESNFQNPSKFASRAYVVPRLGTF